jgi:hypothetical protein
MRVSLRRPPSTLEQLLGRRRARVLRRRLGYIAIGAGVSLLKPRARWAPVALTAAVALTLIVGLDLGLTS